MEKLKFVLKSAGETVILEECDFKREGDFLCFECKDLHISISFSKEKFYFMRESATDKFSIIYDKGNFESFVELKNPHFKTFINLENFEYLYNKNKIIVYYNIESDPERKAIEIHF